MKSLIEFIEESEGIIYNSQSLRIINTEHSDKRMIRKNSIEIDDYDVRRIFKRAESFIRNKINNHGSMNCIVPGEKFIVNPKQSKRIFVCNSKLNKENKLTITIITSWDPSDKAKQNAFKNGYKDLSIINCSLDYDYND